MSRPQVAALVFTVLLAAVGTRTFQEVGPAMLAVATAIFVLWLLTFIPQVQEAMPDAIHLAIFGRKHRSKPLDLTIEHGVYVSTRMTFSDAVVIPASGNVGYVVHVANITLRNPERQGVSVRLYLEVANGDKLILVPAHAACMQEASNSKVQEITEGVLQHLPADILLEQNVPVRGHTEFAILPVFLTEIQTIRGVGMGIVVKDTISGRKQRVS